MYKDPDKLLHRLQADVPVKMHKRLMEISIRDNCTVRQLVIDAVDELLKKDSQRKVVK